jgi:DNA-binding transcriptional regulator YiaG
MKLLAKYRRKVYMAGMESHELKQWRERTGYSQGKLARILGVDVMTVSRWERGIMKAPPFLKLALAYIESEGEKV